MLREKIRIGHSLAGTNASKVGDKQPQISLSSLQSISAGVVAKVAPTLCSIGERRLQQTVMLGPEGRRHVGLDTMATRRGTRSPDGRDHSISLT